MRIARELCPFFGDGGLFVVRGSYAHFLVMEAVCCAGLMSKPCSIHTEVALFEFECVSEVALELADQELKEWMLTMCSEVALLFWSCLADWEPKLCGLNAV